MNRGWLVVAAAGLLWACAPAVSVNEPSPFEEDDPAAMDDRPADRLAAQPAAALGPPMASRSCGPRTPVERRRLIRVERSAYEQTRAAGPGPILHDLEIKPRFAGTRFIGWEIMRFMPCQRRFDGIDLRPGDVVGAVNGRLLARPEHLGALWSELDTANAVVVQVTRAGDAFELRFEVSEDANPQIP